MKRSYVNIRRRSGRSKANKSLLEHLHFGVPHGSRRVVPRDAPVGHRRGNNPVEYVFFIPRDAPVGHRRGNNPVEYVIPRDAPVGHRRGNNPVEYVIFYFIFFFVTRTHKKQCRILIEV